MWQLNLRAGSSVELSASSGEDDEDVLRRVIKRVYDISADDAALRENVRGFETLRAEYPVRREFHTQKLAHRGAHKRFQNTLQALGFRL